MSEDPTPRLAVLRDIESPPGGWKLTIEETGHTVTGSYAKQVRDKALKHMLANAVPVPPDYEEWAEDAMCRESGHGRPWCGTPPPPPVKGRSAVLTLGVAKRFLMTILHAVRERRFVSREEALRRAAICRDCPLAGGIGGCGRGCSAIFKTMERAFPDNPIKTTDEKRYCLACGCHLAYKPWLPNDVLDAAEKGDRPDYWEECWRSDG
jgi:hypothetical protein